MKSEKITILNDKQQKLVGYFYKNTSRTIIIICHGIQSMNTYPCIHEAFQIYHSIGASVFSFDFTGYGESEGVKKLSIKQRLADIEKVINYFVQDYSDIIIYGASMSGVVATLAALKDKRITKLVTINGLFTLNVTQLYPSQVLAILSYLISHPQQWLDVYYWVKNLKIKNISVPTLVVYGEKDEIVNPKQSVDFYNKLKTTKKFIAIPNGDHLLMKKEFLKDTIAIPNWIKQQIIYN